MMGGDMNDVFMRNQNSPVQARPKPHNRANVVQQKLIAQSHQTGLTPDLLKLFAPRPPLEYKPPTEKRKCPPYAGMAQFVSNFAEPGDPEYAPPPKKAETSLERRSRIHKLRLENGARKAAEDLEKYDPSSDPNVSGDPYKTLFVARLTYEATESKIKREFEKYGPIKKVRMVTAETTNKPRGYAFIEYMHTRDMKAAYKQADGMKLDNRRVLVDVERGRTVPNWRPRRLGGGLGSTRVGGQEVNMKFSGREPQQLTAGGPSRSEEPRSREERPVDRGREREREREKSRELSHDRRREREPREERRHKERDRRDRDKDREHGRGHERSRDRDTDRGKDRDRARDRERDGGRKRPREMERDHDPEELDRGHERSRDEDFNYEHGESKKGRHRRGDRDRDHDHSEGRYEFPETENGHFEDPRDQGQYNHLVSQDEPSEHKTNSG